MDTKNNEDILKEEIHSLYALHLGLAFDEMREAEDLFKDTSNRHNWFKAHRLSLSSILHAFCSLEALLNYLGYRRFFILKLLNMFYQKSEISCLNVF